MNPSINNNITVNSAPTTPTIGSLDVSRESSVIEPTVTAPPSVLPALSPYPKLEASAPTLQSNEITFKLKLLSILQNLISSDFSLIQNLIETTKNIILNVNDLHELISILCETNNIDIISRPKVSGCCASASSLIYYEIERSVVNGFDLMIAYNNVYNTLRSNNISLDHVIPDGIAL
jgi:hypothetical protein